MKIHIVQHVSFEGPGYIENWAKQRNFELTYTLLYEKKPTVPKVEDIDALIIMGGPMSVNDEHLYIWMAQEKEFITTCILHKKKILGICLGAQMIASCLGARVYPAPNKEIGWYPVLPNPSLDTNWLTTIFKQAPTVFHWHGEKFDLPQDTQDLLTSAANNHQAFLINEHILGLQFHLEANMNSINAMLAHGQEELTAQQYIQTTDEILDNLNHVPAINQLMKKILDRFLTTKI